MKSCLHARREPGRAGSGRQRFNAAAVRGAGTPAGGHLEAQAPGGIPPSPHQAGGHKADAGAKLDSRARQHAAAASPVGRHADRKTTFCSGRPLGLQVDAGSAAAQASRAGRVSTRKPAGSRHGIPGKWGATLCWQLAPRPACSALPPPPPPTCCAAQSRRGVQSGCERGPPSSPARTLQTAAAPAGTCGTGGRRSRRSREMRGREGGRQAGWEAGTQRSCGGCREAGPHERPLASPAQPAPSAFTSARPAHQPPSITSLGWAAPPAAPRAASSDGSGSGRCRAAAAEAGLGLSHTHSMPACCRTGKEAAQLLWLAHAMAACSGESACGMATQRPAGPNCQP